MNPYLALKWIWIGFGMFWVLAAFTQKRSVRRQSAGSRLAQLGIIALAIAPFYVLGGWLGVLRERFVAATPQIHDLGLLMVVVGLGFAIWARFTIGRNWSGTVTVKENHVLITRGPYAWVRHPIYTGVLLALLGTAFVGGTIASLLAVAFATVALWWKLRIEERFMADTFGEQYTAYRLRVKALIPGVL